ncbi:M56 family metallopeptidase [Kitasatospora sp. MAP5-34]|uniref:M56 family metallopeptidase n=1 Tax=Kitasatospora sp. MAP5-34 TaxID=3035102 RepID=UPI002473707F|nr:M56 family metallopeptidase [Kitasatospora sp. MAP5-34]MDH6576905.1 Zn-dependent protease with chaperone function [Kitasatospora sp. MAP5-34]
MGVFFFLPLVLPLTVLPIARLAGQHLHPRSATRLLTVVGSVLALCSTVCLVMLVVVGTAQVPGNPLPDGWSDPDVRAAVPYAEFSGTLATAALAVACAGCARVIAQHCRIRRQARLALGELSAMPELAILPDAIPYAYALPGAPGRIVVSTGMLACLDPDERRVLVAHERAHLTGRHHRFLLATQVAASLNPFLRPLRAAVAYSTERWADEEAAQVVGDRRLTARAVGKAALSSQSVHHTGVLGFATSGPVPRRIAALLAPAPPTRRWPPAGTPAGLAALVAAAGTTASALSALNAAVALLLVLREATPL